MMTVEQAKHELLNPPPAPEGPSAGQEWLRENVAWVSMLAAAVGFLVSNPRRVRGVSRAAFATPMARRMLTGLIAGLVARRIPQE